MLCASTVPGASKAEELGRPLYHDSDCRHWAAKAQHAVIWGMSTGIIRDVVQTYRRERRDCRTHGSPNWEAAKVILAAAPAIGPRGLARWSMTCWLGSSRVMAPGSGAACKATTSSTANEIVFSYRGRPTPRLEQ
jgi:hypothetical protein